MSAEDDDAPEITIERAPDDTPSPTTATLTTDELRALIVQAADESAARVRAHYERDPRIQRGLELAAKYDAVRERLAAEEVERDARRDHREEVWRRTLERYAERERAAGVRRR